MRTKVAPHLAWRFNPGSVKSVLPQTALEGQSSQGQLPHSHALNRRLTTKREAVPAARGASASCRRQRHDTRPSTRKTWRGEEALEEQGSLPRAARGQEKNKKSIANSRQKKSIANSRQEEERRQQQAEEEHRKQQAEEEHRQQQGKKKSIANSKARRRASTTAGKRRASTNSRQKKSGSANSWQEEESVDRQLVRRRSSPNRKATR